LRFSSRGGVRRWRSQTRPSWQASCAVDLPPNGPWRRGQYEFDRGANYRLKEVTAAGGAIAQTESHVNVEEGVIVVQREVPGYRQEFGLFVLLVMQIGVFLRIEVADLGAAQGADAGEMPGHKVMLLSECQQALHDLLPGVEYQEVCRGLPGIQQLGIRQIGRAIKFACGLDGWVRRKQSATGGRCHRSQGGVEEKASSRHGPRTRGKHVLLSTFRC
jgi:hypothetical protein